MELTYYGAGCVLVATKQLKILVDPPEASYKVKAPTTKADVVLHTTHKNGGFKHQKQFEIDSPGEFEIKKVSIRGIGAQLHVDKPKDPWKGVMYVLEHNGIRALVTGNIAPNLNEEQVDYIGDINVLVVPVGGHGLTLDANAAAGLASQLEPNYVVPVHYDDGKTKYPMPQDKADSFLKEVGSDDTKEESKFKVSAKNLDEGTSVVLLQRQG